MDDPPVIHNRLAIGSIEAAVDTMGRAQITYLEDHQEAALPIWTEALFATELLMLHADPL